MDDRVEDLLSQMTIEEKIHLLKGSGMASALGRLEPGEGIPGVVGTIVSTPRLLEKGNYKIAFGISSRDIKGAVEVQL